jgi:peptidoglycan/xylan/chitin deacetylase (PgdA/CDA1 family)
MRSHVAPAAKSALLESGLYSILRRAVPSRQVAILRYHAICTSEAGYASPGICVSPDAFEAHVDYLATHYRVLSLSEAVSYLSQRKTLPPNAVVITFDDGYADNLPAARTLARYGVSATFYLTAGCLAGGQPFWPAELRSVIGAITSDELALDVNGSVLTLPVATPDERAAAVSRLTKVFKSHPIAVRERIREQLRLCSRIVDEPSPMLTWDDVRAIHRLGMTIGSHTVTHPNLPSAGRVDAEQEIRRSKAMLEEQIDVPVTMFSYPNGGADRYMTPEVRGLVKDAGYDAATTSRNAFAGSDSDVYALERVQVAETLADLVFALEVERFVLRPKPRVGEQV